MKILKTVLPPRYTKQRGSGFLIMALVGAAIVGISSLSLAKVNSVALSSMRSNNVALQAYQYADAEAQLVRATDYTNLSAQTKTNIQNSDFQKEITLSEESDYSDEIKQKTATVKIYKNGEELPRISLNILRLSKEQKSSGVPIGTVITWPSNNPPTESGIWLECNGQSCSAYPTLVAVLGKSTVPNYSGVFLRSYGTRTNNGIVHSSGSLGMLQNMAFPKTMSGIFYAVNTSGLSPTGPFKQVGNYRDYGLKDNSGFGDGLCKGIQFDLSSVIPKANELRPINVAVRYFIKAT